MKKIISLAILAVLATLGYAQHTDANIFGDVKSNGEHLPFVSIYIKGSNKGTATDLTGHYMLIDLPAGKHTVVANRVGFKPIEKKLY